MKVGVFFLIDKYDWRILDILKRLQQAKKADGVIPTIVDMVEIQQAASKAALEELRSLYKEGKVQHHETLNGHAFSVKLWTK